VRRRHVHQPCPRKTVECPQSADRKDDAGLSGVVGAGSRNWPPSLVAQENLALPIVQTGEPDPVGEFRDGDMLLGTPALSLTPRVPRGQQRVSYNGCTTLFSADNLQIVAGLTPNNAATSV